VDHVRKLDRVLDKENGNIVANDVPVTFLSVELHREAPDIPRQAYPAEEARGGEIILKTPSKRAIFLAGLVGAAILAIILILAR
jgi:hypothetical protein